MKWMQAVVCSVTASFTLWGAGCGAPGNESPRPKASMKPATADAAAARPVDAADEPSKPSSAPVKDASFTDLPAPPATTPAPMPWVVEDIGAVGLKGEA